MRLQGAIFDLDGTLLDSRPFWLGLGAALLREWGAEPEPELNRHLRGMSLPETAEYFRRHYGVPLSAQEILGQVHDRATAFYSQTVTAKADAEKFLSLLKMEGVWMYAATSLERPLAESGLRRTGLFGFFRGILTCAEAGAGKEDPRIYEKCLTRLRCRREDCVVFEDSIVALRTAKTAGFRTAAVFDESTSEHWEELRALADESIVSYGEWLERSEV